MKRHDYPPSLDTRFCQHVTTHVDPTHSSCFHGPLAGRADIWTRNTKQFAAFLSTSFSLSVNFMRSHNSSFSQGTISLNPAALTPIFLIQATAKKKKKNSEPDGNLVLPQLFPWSSASNNLIVMRKVRLLCQVSVCFTVCEGQCSQNQ